MNTGQMETQSGSQSVWLLPLALIWMHRNAAALYRQ